MARGQAVGHLPQTEFRGLLSTSIYRYFHLLSLRVLFVCCIAPFPFWQVRRRFNVTQDIPGDGSSNDSRLVFSKVILADNGIGSRCLAK
jgi:hypothetical protein